MELKAAFGGFSVSNVDEAKDFYTNTIGLELEDEKMGLKFKLPSGGSVFIYGKDDHQAAAYTVFNLVVGDIDVAVDELVEKGVKFEIYENLFPGAPPQDEKGITRSPDPVEFGPTIAWFKDPAGNVVAVLEDK